MNNINLKNKIKIFWPFFSYKFIKGIFFITNITFFIFFKEKGLSYLQASFLMSLLFLLPIFFEIITGLVADTIGRKVSVLIGITSETLIVLSIIFISNYLFLIFLFVLWGVATTFSSGADDSWAIESVPKDMQEDIKEKLLDHYYSISSSLFSAGMIVAGLLSSLILSFNGQNGVWISRVFFGIILIFICLLTKENFKSNEYPNKKKSLSILKDNIVFSFNHVKNGINTRQIIIGELFITISLVAVGGAVLQKYLTEAGLLDNKWGLAYSISAALGIILPFVSIYLSKRFKNKKYYLIFVLAVHIGLFILASFFLNPIFGFLFIMMHNLLEDLFNTVNSILFQLKIPSGIRATVSSIRNTSLGLGASIGMFSGGLLVNYFNIKIAIVLPALLLIPAMLMYKKIK